MNVVGNFLRLAHWDRQRVAGATGIRYRRHVAHGLVQPGLYYAEPGTDDTAKAGVGIYIF